MDEINELKRSGMSIQAISELTGYDRKTIRKYLLKPERPVYPARPVPASKTTRPKSDLSIPLGPTPAKASVDFV